MRIILPEKSQQRWSGFRTELQIRSREVVSLAENTSFAFTTTAFVGAGPFAASFIDEFLVSTNSVFWQDFLVGSGSDYLTQKALDMDVNWTSIIVSGLFKNPISYSLIISSFGSSRKGIGVRKTEDIVTGNLTGGTFGAAGAGFMKKFPVDLDTPSNERASLKMGEGLANFWNGALSRIGQQELCDQLNKTSKK